MQYVWSALRDTHVPSLYLTYLPCLEIVHGSDCYSLRSCISLDLFLQKSYLSEQHAAFIKSAPKAAQPVPNMAREPLSVIPECIHTKHERQQNSSQTFKWCKWHSFSRLVAASDEVRANSADKVCLTGA